MATQEQRLVFVVSAKSDEFEKVMKAVKKALGDTGKEGKGSAKAASAAWKKAGKQISGSFGKLKKGLGGLKGAFAGLAGVAGMGAVAKAAMKFEKSMAEISTILDNSESKMAGISQTVRDTAVAFGQTQASTAKAQYDIISAGFQDAADSAEVLNVSARLATAGVAEIGPTADLLTTVLNGFSLSAEQSEHVADILFLTVKRGKTTLNEMSQVFGQLGSSAFMAGIDLEEVAATFAVLTSNGIKSAEASTALNRLMMAIAAPTGDAAKAFEDLGIQLHDIDSSGRNVAKPLNEIFQQMEGLDAGVMTEMFPSIRATKALGSAVSDMDKFNTVYDEFLEKKTTEGTLDEAFGKIAESNSFKMQQMRSGMQDLMVEMGMGFTDELGQGAEFANDNLEEMRKTAKDLGETLGAGLKAAAVFLRENWSWVSKLALAFIAVKLALPFVLLIQGLITAIPLIIAAVGKTWAWVVAQKALGVASLGAKAGIAGVVLAIGLLIAAPLGRWIGESMAGMDEIKEKMQAMASVTKASTEQQAAAFTLATGMIEEDVRKQVRAGEMLMTSTERAYDTMTGIDVTDIFAELGPDSGYAEHAAAMAKIGIAMEDLDLTFKTVSANIMTSGEAYAESASLMDGASKEMQASLEATGLSSEEAAAKVDAIFGALNVGEIGDAMTELPALLQDVNGGYSTFADVVTASMERAGEDTGMLVSAIDGIHENLGLTQAEFMFMGEAAQEALVSTTLNLTDQRHELAILREDLVEQRKIAADPDTYGAAAAALAQKQVLRLNGSIAHHVTVVENAKVQVDKLKRSFELVGQAAADAESEAIEAEKKAAEAKAKNDRARARNAAKTRKRAADQLRKLRDKELNAYAKLLNDETSLLGAAIKQRVSKLRIGISQIENGLAVATSGAIGVDILETALGDMDSVVESATGSIDAMGDRWDNTRDNISAARTEIGNTGDATAQLQAAIVNLQTASSTFNFSQSVGLTSSEVDQVRVRILEINKLFSSSIDTLGDVQAKAQGAQAAATREILQTTEDGLKLGSAFVALLDQLIDKGSGVSDAVADMADSAVFAMMMKDLGGMEEGLDSLGAVTEKYGKDAAQALKVVMQHYKSSGELARQTGQVIEDTTQTKKDAYVEAAQAMIDSDVATAKQLQDLVIQLQASGDEAAAYAIAITQAALASKLLGDRSKEAEKKLSKLSTEVTKWGENAKREGGVVRGEIKAGVKEATAGKDGLVKAGHGVGGFFSGMATGYGKSLLGLFDLFTDWGNTSGNVFKRMGKQWKGFVDGVVGPKTNTVRQAVKGVIAEMNAMKAAGGDTSNAESQIKAGMEERAGAAVQQGGLKGFVGMIKEAKNLKAMEEEFGAAGYEGLAQGAAALRAEVKGKIKKALIGALVAGAAAAAKLMGKLIGAVFSKGVDLLKQGLAIAASPESLATFQESMSTLSGNLTGMGDRFGSMMSTLINELPEMAAKLADEIPKIATQIAEKLPELAKVLADSIGPIIMALLDALPDIVDALLEAVLGLVDYLVENIDAILASAIEALASIMGSIGDFIAGIFVALETLIPKLVAALMTLLAEGLPKMLKSIFEAIPALISGLLQGVVEIIKGLVVLLVETLPQILTDLMAALPDMLTALIVGVVDIVNALITELIPRLPDIVMNIISSILMAIPELISVLVTELVHAVPEIITAIFEMLPELIGEIVTLVIIELPAIIIALIAGIVQELPYLIYEIVLALGKSILGIFTGLFKGFGKLGKTFSTAVENAGKFFAKVGTSFKALGQKFKDATVSFGKWVKKHGQAMWDWLGDLWKSFVKFLKKLGETLSMGIGTSGKKKEDRKGLGKVFGAIGDAGKWVGGKAKGAWDATFGKLFFHGGMPRAQSGMFLEGLGNEAIPLLAHAGEAILNRRAVEMFGGSQGMLAMNNGLMPQQTRAAAQLGGNGFERMGGGGDTIVQFNGGAMFARSAGSVVDELQDTNFKRGKGRVRRYLSTQYGNIPGLKKD